MSRPKLSAGFCFLNSYEREEFLHLKRFFYLRCSLTKPYRTVTQKLKYVPKTPTELQSPTQYYVFTIFCLFRAKTSVCPWFLFNNLRY